MDRFDILLDILEKSLIKNGDKVLTIRHLINILKLVDKIDQKNEFRLDIIEASIDMYD